MMDAHMNSQRLKRTQNLPRSAPDQILELKGEDKWIYGPIAKPEVISNSYPLENDIFGVSYVYMSE